MVRPLGRGAAETSRCVGGGDSAGRVDTRDDMRTCCPRREALKGRRSSSSDEKACDDEIPNIATAIRTRDRRGMRWIPGCAFSLIEIDQFTMAFHHGGVNGTLVSLEVVRFRQVELIP